MLEVDARISSGVLITLLYDPIADSSQVTICDEDSSRTLVAKDRAEAIEMFHHPFAYSQKVNESDLIERIAAYS